MISPPDTNDSEETGFDDDEFSSPKDNGPIHLHIDPAKAGARLDKALAAACPQLSRSRLQDLIRQGHVHLDGQPVTKPRHPLAAGDRIAIHLPPPAPAGLLAQDIPLAILHEDDDLLVIDKPPGLVIHPAAGNPDGTLVNALLHHCHGRLSGIGGIERPGIVHRLDKETSGCLVAAKTDPAHRELARQFADRETVKTYLCVAQGVPRPPEGFIENRLGRHPGNRQKMTVRPAPHGKEARTGYRVLQADPAGAWSLVRCDLFTGRTHQIRVHLKESLHCPILGDEIYALVARQAERPGRLMLHAWRLAITHPATGRRMTFESPLPPAFHPYLPPGVDPTLLDRRPDPV